MVKGKLSLLILSGILVFIISSCGFTTSIEEDTSSLSVVISNPLEDISVSVGEGVAITSTSFSESGIAKVELLVSGQVIVTNGLQDSSTTFVATQNWVPVIPGTFPISVAVEDVDGQRVQSDLLTVTVLEQIAEQPTESTETPLPTLPPSTEEPVTPLPTATPESPQAETPTPTSESPLLLAPIPIEIVPILPTSTPMIKPLPGQLKPIIIPLASPNIQFSVADIQIPPGETRSVSAVCLEEALATGGGFTKTSYSVDIQESLWESPHGWKITANNTSDKNQTVQAIAVCLHNSGGTITPFEYWTYIDADVDPVVGQDLSVTCPVGSVVTGGGFAKADRDLFVRQSSPSGNGWVVRASHNTNTSKQVYAQALCLSGTNAIPHQFMEYVAIGAGKDRSVEVMCQPGQLVSGGGFLQEIASYASYPIGPNATEPKFGWYLSANNPAHHTTFTIYVYVTCLEFP